MPCSNGPALRYKKLKQLKQIKLEDSRKVGGNEAKAKLSSGQH